MDPSIAGKKILIVDDDSYLLGFYAAKFKDEGFGVTTAEDGQEAWDLIAGGYRPDVMFTGILMPRMTGFDLIRKMQAEAELAKIPVAISSHRGRPEDKATAKELGVDDFLIQGLVPLNEVVRRIQRLLGVEHSYRLQLVPGKFDADTLVAFLEKQDLSSSAGDADKQFFLELEPLSEKGTFLAKLIREDTKR